MVLQEYKVWDATTRVFHWVNVLCMVGLIALGTTILNASSLGIPNSGKIILKTVHVWVGYVFILNLLWRLIWAFIGGPFARWRAILPFGSGYTEKLSKELAALRGQSASHSHTTYAGHSPLGRIAVTILLLCLVIQGVSGIVLAGTDVYMPPLGGFFAEWVAADGLSASQVLPYAPDTVNPDAYAEMRALRSPFYQTHEFTYFVLLGLIALHIFAVVLTDIKRGGGIISAMFTGKKVFATPPEDISESQE
ncbi:MAG: cytochrome b/b6 domain-containing protein [Rhodospirillaceae bacterium]